MNIAIIVQARLGSSRLPRKVLADVCGQPLIRLMMTRLQDCMEASELIVATVPKDAAEIGEALHDLAGVSVVAPDVDENNVFDRFRGVIYRHGGERMPKAIVRLCADSPLIDPEHVDNAIERFRNCGKAILTTALQPTFPSGQHVEIIRTAGWNRAGGPANSITDEEREHVMPYWYRVCDPSVIEHYTAPAGENWSHVRTVVDTQDDLDKLRMVVKGMKRDHWTYDWRDIAEMYA